MNLSRPIESAELKYKQILEDFFISIYDDNSLTSHGIDHHRRVWNYSKGLLQSRLQEVEKNRNDPVILWYFNELEKELAE